MFVEGPCYQLLNGFFDWWPDCVADKWCVWVPVGSHAAPSEIFKQGYDDTRPTCVYGRPKWTDRLSCTLQTQTPVQRVANRQRSPSIPISLILIIFHQLISSIILCTWRCYLVTVKFVIAVSPYVLVHIKHASDLHAIHKSTQLRLQILVRGVDPIVVFFCVNWVTSVTE